MKCKDIKKGILYFGKSFHSRNQLAFCNILSSFNKYEQIIMIAFDFSLLRNQYVLPSSIIDHLK